MHRYLLTDTLDDQIDRAKEIVGPVVVTTRPVRIQSKIERIFQAPDSMRIVIVHAFRIDIGKGRCGLFFQREMMHVVVGGALSHITIAEIDGLGAVTCRVDTLYMAHPIGIGTEQIDQDAVKSIPLLKCH